MNAPSLLRGLEQPLPRGSGNIAEEQEERREEQEDREEGDEVLLPTGPGCCTYKLPASVIIYTKQSQPEVQHRWEMG